MKAKDILKVLSLQDFADFYGAVSVDDNSPFSKWLMGDEDAPTEKEILKEIKEIFHLKG